MPLLLSMVVSVAGDGAFFVAAPLLAAALTDDPFAVSTVVAVAHLPWLLVGLPVGVIVDRTDRQLTMMVADLTRALLLAFIAVAVFVDLITVPVLVFLVALVGVAQTFFDSAVQALIPSMVGRDRNVLTRTNGRIWAIDVTGRALVGPPLGSWTFGVAHMLPFVLDALSFVVSATFVRRLPGAPARPGPHPPVWRAIGTGLRHLVDTVELRLLAWGTVAYNFGYHVAAGTLVLFVTKTLELSNTAYGILLALGAVGGISSAWFAGAVVRSFSHYQVMAGAVLVQAVSWLAVALVAVPWVLGLALTVVGACNSLASVAVSVARHQTTPDELLGRVVTTFRFAGLGASGLGALVGGLVAARWGLGAPLAVGGGMLLLFAAGFRARVRRAGPPGNDPAG
ncbi:MAG TPA: MFS transporter [Micromonosporaceae bacterium]|nr:MFS transporter [Micromonosporaceae bacterium]